MPDQLLDLGAKAVPGGFFLLRRNQGEPFVATAEGGPYRHRFSYRNSEPTIQETAVKMVRQARRKVFLASFRIGDKLLLEALFEAAQRLRGGVYVITSWNQHSLRNGLAALEDDAEADFAAQHHRFNMMTERGIFVRGHDQCHAKFLAVDDETALVSSANLETSALMDRPQRKVTGEDGALITDRVEVERLGRLFTRLWFSGCRYEAAPGAQYTLGTRTPAPTPCEPQRPPIADRPGIIWTHEDEHLILDTIHDIIDRAREELLLATFGLRGLSKHKSLLHDRLADARRRGVAITLLCRARNNLPEHRAEALALAELGVRVVGDQLTHAKAAIADGRHGALFSANLDSEHGLTNGVEVGVRLDGTPALAEAHRYLQHAIAHADLTFQANPLQSELDEAFGAFWRRPWPGERTLKVSATDQAWHALVEAVSPALYTQQDDGVTRLHAGGGEWLLNNEQLQMLTEPTHPEKTLSLMDSWWRSSDSEAYRGFVPIRLVRNQARALSARVS